MIKSILNKNINYSKIFLLSIIFLAIISINLNAADGDTIKVRTVEFTSAQTGKFLMPSADKKFSKILMNYKFKCPCGQWDYLKYVIIDSIEVFRFITPYGIGLSVGTGFTWTVDVTDFGPLLHDSVYIDASNAQEKIELTFDFIEGTPERDIIRFEPLWMYSYNNYAYYDSNFEKTICEKPVLLTKEEKMARLKLIQTGHGGNGGACCEFANKTGYVKVDGVTRYTQTVWRDDCPSNPIYPQGGTWLLPRSNWCPGADVKYYNFELSPYITPGDTVKIDYNMDTNYDKTGNTDHNYRFVGYLITYSNPNFANHASVVDIISPSVKNAYQRFNPICNNAQIMIQNGGSADLTSLDIRYGVRGADTAIYHWTGDLPFLQVDTLTLPPWDWGDWENKGNIFYVELYNPNGKTDDYPIDTKSEATFTSTSVNYNNFVINYKTNQYATIGVDLFSYTLKNAQGEIIGERDESEENTIYSDTFNLANGCYEFNFKSAAEYGLAFAMLAPPNGDELVVSGWLKLFSRGVLVSSFNPDFGSHIYYQFTVAPKPTIAVSEDTLYFGTVDIGKDTTISLEITPDNSAGLTVKSISMGLSSSKGYSLVSSTPDISKGSVTLKENEKLTLNVKFSPQKAGDLSATIMIYSNDIVTSQKNIKVIGAGSSPYSVENQSQIIPLNLEANPNPFSDKITIKYSAGDYNPVDTKLVVYNSLGQEIKILHEGKTYPTENIIVLNGNDLNPGTYYLVLNSGKNNKVIPIVLIQ